MIIIIILKMMMMMMMTTTNMMMMTIVKIVIIITTVIIALKGAIRDFCNLLTAPRTFSNTHAQVVMAKSCANHVQHIERLSRATCRVPRGVKGQLSCLTESESHSFLA